ncbi:hypothetical protein HPP92_005432 [Vanilla planifolia]|uniref:Association with the SNF1 complex (ASC) domain-containing protein n=1 Tax=Vanilla planifolia TaxID=51239 RepID=A0A835VEN8_VANPL|nr:hypothetical protein HPP92_005432 [Vanilla planifolia]
MGNKALNNPKQIEILIIKHAIWRHMKRYYGDEARRPGSKTRHACCEELEAVDKRRQGLQVSQVQAFASIGQGFVPGMGFFWPRDLFMEVGTCVMGFEVPRSPDSSYINPIPGNEDEARDPPRAAPPHLQHTLLSYPASQEGSRSLPLPQNVILNHLYIENRESKISGGFGYYAPFSCKVCYRCTL